MSILRNFISANSIRKQYLFLVFFLASVIVIYTWFTGLWIDNTSRDHVTHIEKRLEIADINHQLGRAIIGADNALHLFLLSPSQETRHQFMLEFEQAQRHANAILETEWAKKSDLMPVLYSLKPTLNKIWTAGREIMDIRETAKRMYPAIRTASGDMLERNRTIVVQTNLAIQYFENKNVKRLPKHQLELLLLLESTRSTWLQVVSAYRLFLVNRTGSLFDSAFEEQIGDVEAYYTEFGNKVNQLAVYNSKYKYDLEVKGAIEEIAKASPKWYAGFEQIKQISTEGNWRADIPLITETFNPLFNELFDKVNMIDDALKQSSDVDLEEQRHVSRAIIQSLWGMALFVLLLSVLSFIVLEINFIRPIGKVARSLKAEATGSDAGELPDVKTEEIRHLIDAFIELRHQVHSRQLALEHIAMHDALTSLPNRTLLMDRLNQAILSSQRRKRSLALLMLDLDRFKEINDTLGHQTGDALLQQVGARLRMVLRDSDTVARLGGDEFAILLSNVNDTNALRIATAIHEQLEKVYEVYEHSLYVGVSIGIAIFPQHGETAESLLQHADVAMYVAKRSNSGITLYDTERDEHSVMQLSVLSDLRGAIENEEFVLYYQPKLSMSDGRITGSEALIRWQHPKQGLIMPDEFINVAEQTGLIKRLSLWVLDRAIRDCKRLHDKGYEMDISVNLSVWDIQDPNISLNIAQKLQKWGLPPAYLILEITERVMMAEPERAKEVLINLTEMGLQVVIDDFGTGFSSLVYLKQLPVSMLKIDKSFVCDMMHDESDAAIVHSIIELAHNLELQVVAEGVENDQTWSWLKTWKCDYAQGFYIGHPIAIDEFEHYLENYPTKEQQT